MQKGDAIAFMTSTGGNGWEREDNKDIYLPVIQASGWDGKVAAIEKNRYESNAWNNGIPI